MNKNKKLCLECKGNGLIKCERVKCTFCDGSPSGCFRHNCKGGYIQHNYIECPICIGSGQIQKDK